MNSQFENDFDETIPQTNDIIMHPSHYTDGSIEVWDYIREKNLNYFRRNAVKYISRAGKKNPQTEIEDLEKAKAYIEKELVFLYQNALAE